MFRQWVIMNLSMEGMTIDIFIDLLIYLHFHVQTIERSFHECLQ